MFTILFLYTVTPAWLRLSRDERNAFNAAQVRPVLERHAGRVSARFCDAEAFTGRCSDFAVFGAARLEDFYFMLEELRDTALFTEPYLTVNDLIVGLEDGFERYEASRGAEGAPPGSGLPGIGTLGT